MAAVSADEHQYPAFVAEELTAVRSGPGDQFYETSSLSWGSRVDVFRHDDDYAGIRPPEGSFSWVAAEAVEIDANQTIATVRLANFKTRIGSSVGEHFDAEYVTLKVGEQVEVLGFQTVDDGTSTREWVKISPPAGEFRWVKLCDLQKTPPVRNVREDAEGTANKAVEKATAVADQPSKADQQVSSVETPSDLGNVDDLPASRDGETELQDDEPHRADRIATVASPAAIEGDTESNPGSAGALEGDGREVESRALSSKEQVALTQWSSAAAQNADDTESLTSAPLSEIVPQPQAGSSLGFSEVSRRISGDTSPEYLAAQLAQLELAVSQEVCKPTSQWQLQGIQARCLAVIDAAASTEIRQRAYALLAKVVQFEDVRRRDLRLTTSQPAASPNLDHSASTANVPSLAPPPATPATLYDGTGWLMPVLTNRTDVPRYVLTDDQGQVLQFVSPQPGLNLSRYERKKIGIFGRRGYLPSVSQPHLMAERIVTLDRVR